jgi:hypothetical protein
VRCHTRQVAATKRTTGHRNCLECHENAPHGPAPPPACGTCHTEQAATAPGGHRDCSACHTAHDGGLRQKTCTTCHVQRQDDRHARLRGGCATCHRPHGPKGVATPPVCTDCHTRSALPNLHRLPGHASCRDCHTQHGPPPAGRRADCLTCHAAQVDHEPAATACIGCHPFGR